MRRVTGEVHIASLQALVDPVGNVKIRFPHRGAGNFSHWNFREQFPPIADNPPHGGIPGVARGVVDDAKEEHKSSVMEEHVSEVGFEGGFQGQVREMPRRDKTAAVKINPKAVADRAVRPVCGKEPGALHSFGGAIAAALQSGFNAVATTGATNKPGAAPDFSACGFER